MSVYLDDGDVVLHHGDALTVLAALPTASVHCAVTSPPYWGLRDYGVDGQLGLEQTPEEYVAAMVAVFREVRRVLRPDGTLWLNVGDSYAGGGGFAPNAPSNLNGSKQTTQRGAKPGGVPVTAGLKPKDLIGIPWRLALALQAPYYTGRIAREQDRIWLAAMIDAEGCMFIHRRKAGQSNGQGYFRKEDGFGAGLEVSNTNIAIVERCQQITGLGSICSQTPEQNPTRKQTIYRWSLRSNVCRDVVREVYPDLVAKQHEGRLLFGCPSSGERASAAHEALKLLHNGGLTDVDFPAPASMFEQGWWLRSDVIWAKKNCMPESVTDRPTSAHEHVFLLTPSARYFYDADAVREPMAPESEARYAYGFGGAKNEALVEANQNGMGVRTRVVGTRDATDGRNLRNVWSIATEPTPEAHFATFPQALVERCLKAGCPEGGAVLDPFVGSGTTCLVARRLGLRAVGIDLSAEYLAIAAKRLRQLSLFAGTANT